MPWRTAPGSPRLDTHAGCTGAASTREPARAVPSGAHPDRWIVAGRLGVAVGLLAACLAPLKAHATTSSEPPLRFPTPNRALLEPGGEEQFYVGTAGHPWTHGMFGCTRSGGWQFHEGIDIRATQRDRRNEPTDPIYATAAGRVVYVNRKASLSNYGIYLVLAHKISGLDVWSLYAHLSAVREDLVVGQTVAAGDRIATMGRTSNTGQTIAKDRAHLHFELGFLVHHRFAEWLKQNVAGARNDHGVFNGQNFIGIDPGILLRSSHRFSDSFDLTRYLTVQRELFRVAVRATNLDWARRYPSLVQNTNHLSSEAIAGYEIHFDYCGVPVRIYPRSEAELPSKDRYTLIEVDEMEYNQYPCRRLVTRQDNRFRLGSRGRQLLDLLTF